MGQPLSKTSFMMGLQCGKSLYLRDRHPALESPLSLQDREILQHGIAVGKFAHRYYPDGVLIDAPHWDLEQCARLTHEALKAGHRTLFEATFLFERYAVRVNILDRDSNGGWHLMEVKASTSLKPEHLPDLTFQYWVASRCGIPVTKASVMHLNRFATAPELTNLFVQQDVTLQVRELLSTVEESAVKLLTLLEEPNVPVRDIGPHCHSPHTCGFVDHCWKDLPKKNLFEFPGIYKSVWELFRAGVRTYTDERFGPFEGTRAAQLAAARSGKLWADAKRIQQWLQPWKYPLYCLDFETISYPIPKYPGTHPWEEVPFQFSLLVQKAPGSPPEHFEYLHTKDTDPRPELTRLLITSIGREGSIAAYSKDFEERCLRALGLQSPEFSSHLNSICERLVDPLPIFRSAVYHPDFKGSFSMKSVAPALLGEAMRYDNKPIPDGRAAQRAFAEIIAADTSVERRRELEASLRSYCHQDTEGLLGLIEWLRSYIASSAE